MNMTSLLRNGKAGGLGFNSTLLFTALSGIVCLQTAVAQNLTPVQTHEEAYLAALEKVTQGEARIANEMQRVQSGAVAHYDFLQYEHIELVRHAQALAYPPSAMDSATRAVIATEAAQLVDSANAMEWVIADFLRESSRTPAC